MSQDIDLQKLLDLFTLQAMILIAMVLIVSWVLSTGINIALSWLAERWTAYRMRVLRVIPILRTAIWALAIWIILIPILSPDGESVTALFWASTLAAGLAFQDTLKNAIGGLSLLFYRPFQIGDMVQVEEHYGEVISLSIGFTTLRTLDDNLIKVPNATFITKNFANANTGTNDLQVVIDLFLPQTTDVDKAEKIAWEAAISSPYVYLDKPVVVLVSEIMQQTLQSRIRIKGYVLDTRLQSQFHSDVSKRAKRGFQAAGLYAER